MYAALVSAGVSQLSDLYDSITSKSSSGASTQSFPSPDDTTQPTGPVNSTGTSGSNLSAAVQKLLTDLQANASTSPSADATNTIAGDLKSVLGSGKGGHHGGHHHAGGPPPASTSGSDQNASTASDPLNSLASSLLAYGKTASLTTQASSTSTSA